MPHVAHLLHEARRALHVPSQGALGVLLGSSERSGQRWERGESSPSPSQVQKLARLVHPHDEALAQQLAASTGTSLVQLGIVQPPPDPVHLVDAVVCAAADAMQLVPDAVRPALRAAFRRARQAGLSVETVDATLNGPPAASPSALARRTGKPG